MIKVIRVIRLSKAIRAIVWDLLDDDDDDDVDVDGDGDDDDDD